ncbi:hypothetical protein ACFFMM_12285 [Micromonospora chaiyaphumensis]|uniref:Uncharacterized protein n=1 Tax=Micromonospora chaiyaphumensis TaxID=307119 RepID=A0A1C4WEB5_9ACTN|nr:hypothetical protein [Micromonospora chaiyaphumensis]SCE94530.1 hypothetical protein GA0070214_103488 [Micromonospora chaiyaphumensis]
MEALDVLAAFGSTGRLGLLHPGVRLREVVAAYGMPWDIGRIHKRHRWPHLYSYGDVEFVACRCRIITSVTVQTWRGTVELPNQAQPGEVIALPARLTFAQVADALADADCQWERLEPIAGQRGLRTLQQRVDFTFITSDGPDPVLHAVGTSAHDHDCMPPAAADAAFADDFPAEQAN